MSDHLYIDFERAANLMDVVQKVASVAPAYTALSGVAMGELKKYNETAQEYLNELGRERLAEEQEAAKRLEQERLDSEPKSIPTKSFASTISEDPSEPVVRRV